jgi:TonB family protein
MQHVNNPIYLSFTISMFLHVLFIALAPGLSTNVQDLAPYEIIPIELYPEIRSVPDEDLIKLSPATEPKSQEAIPGDSVRLTKGYSIKDTNPDLTLPGINSDWNDADRGSLLYIPKPVLDNSLTSVFEGSILPQGHRMGKEMPGIFSETGMGEKGVPGRLERISPPTDGLSKTLVDKPVIEDIAGIKGPAADRKVVFKPKPPVVTVTVEATITLKFWVFPDGTVGKVVPLVKGDATLEQIAISYLKRWRFTPLSSSEPQEQEWGTIPIKFTTKR